MPMLQPQTTAVYARTTQGITVTVEPTFLEEQSDAEAMHYVWAYHVRIENGGGQTVRLLTRHWRITDGRGTIREVHGDGVVGEQPVLKPGESYEYTSGTPLPTPSGIMSGTYGMATDNGEPIEVAIPAFSLDSPHERRQVH